MGTEFNQVNTQMSDFEMAEPSFEDAFRKHFDSLAHYADQQGARDLQEKGEDVAQVAMMRMANQGDRMNFAAAGPWLHLVAKRIVIDNYRLARNRYEVVTDALELTSYGTDQDEAVHHSMLVEQALSQMSEVQRDAVKMMYLEGRSVKDTAEMLKIPEGTVRSRVFYGIAAARSAFNEMGLGIEDVLG